MGGRDDLIVDRAVTTLETGNSQGSPGTYYEILQYQFDTLGVMIGDLHGSFPSQQPLPSWQTCSCLIYFPKQRSWAPFDFHNRSLHLFPFQRPGFASPWHSRFTSLNAVIERCFLFIFASMPWYLGMR